MKRLTLRFFTGLLCQVIASLCLSHLALEIATLAQDLDSVTISGRVVDQNGAIIKGAIVTAVLDANDVTRAVEVERDGRYRLIELAPGTYTVRASSSGFAVAEKRGVSLVAGQNAQLDFTLRPAGVVAEQTVLSDADSSVIDTTRTIVGGTVTRAEIESLPAPTRAPLDLIFTLGGVTEEPLSTRDLAEDRDRTSARTPEEAGAFALSGGAAYSNNLTIDGLDNNDDRAARERFQPSLEAVEEVQVITNQFSAEYGRASGGRVNLRTRGGTKDWRGRLFYFFRDESLNANSFFNNARGLKRLPLQEHNPGFTLSGPVALPSRFFRSPDDAQPHRAFFFIGYEYDTLFDSTLIDTLVPVVANPRFPLPLPTTASGRRFEASANAPNSPAELAPYVARVSTPLRTHTLNARVDHNYTATHSGAFLYQFGRSKNLRQFGGAARLADALQGRMRDTDAFAYTDNYVFSSRVVNQARAQLSRLTPSLSARGDESRPVVLISLDDPLAADDPSNRSGTLVAGASNAGASARSETRWQMQNVLSILRGAHAWKFGGDAQRIRSAFIDLTDASGTFNFSSAGDFLANAPNRFRQRFNNESVQRNIYSGFFAQDEWHARPNLTLSYGLRYENETIVRDHNNFAPRLALAYDPFRSGKTVVRAGAGVFYNRALLRTVDDFTLGAARIFFDTNSLRDPVTDQLLSDEQRRAFIVANLNFPSTLTTDAPIVHQYGLLQTNFARRLDPTLRVPESYQFNVGFERELRGAFIFEANYTLNRGVHLWREFNANAPRLPNQYKDFAAYLLARDFANFRDRHGTRPLYNAASAGELVRFTVTSPGATSADSIGRVVEFGVPVTIFDLDSVNSTAALNAAHAALNELRPDPARGELEQLAAIGNSFYRGLTLEVRRRFASSQNDLALSFRAAYTLSRLIDDGIVNTSDALRPGDFRGERARSLLDRRQRFVFSGTFDLPRALLRLRLSPILRVASGAPFNISLGGTDRNLDDVGNDRPIFNGDTRLLRARRPDASGDNSLLSAFALPLIGQTGNLPRNAGSSPSLFVFDLNLTREFHLSDRARLRPHVEIDNVLNKTVFAFGAEFINFSALKPTATLEQRQSALDSFLAPTRTLRPRMFRVGLRVDF